MPSRHNLQNASAGAASVPRGAGSVPGGAGSVPGGAGSVPGGAGSVPGGAGSVPGGAGSALDGVASVPCGGDSFPAGAGRVPDNLIEFLGDLDRPRAWMLLVGGVPQSHVDLDDPRYLEFEYMRRLGHVVDLAAPAGAPLRVLHLGGGGLTLARYVAATRQGSDQLAVESSAQVATLVRRRLPLDQPGRPPRGAGRITVRVADARHALERVPAGAFDMLVADVFAGGQTPAHLTSAEFTRAAASALASSGIFAVNVGDGPPLVHARGRVATVRSVFRHACVIVEAGVLRGRRFGNLVVVAADRDLPVAELTRRAAADPFPARVLAGAALDRFVGMAAPVTDADAEPSPALPPGGYA
jgi:spermidine synthase